MLYFPRRNGGFAAIYEKKRLTGFDVGFHSFACTMQYIIFLTPSVVKNWDRFTKRECSVCSVGGHWVFCYMDEYRFLPRLIFIIRVPCFACRIWEWRLRHLLFMLSCDPYCAHLAIEYLARRSQVKCNPRHTECAVKRLSRCAMFNSVCCVTCIFVWGWPGWVRQYDTDYITLKYCGVLERQPPQLLYCNE